MLKFKSVEEYESECRKFGEAFNVSVYGGDAIVYDMEPLYDEYYETSFNRHVGYANYSVSSWEAALYRFSRDVVEDDLLSGWSEKVANACRKKKKDEILEGSIGDFYKSLEFFLYKTRDGWGVHYLVFTHDRDDEDVDTEESESGEGMGIDWFNVILSYFEED